MSYIPKNMCTPNNIVLNLNDILNIPQQNNKDPIQEQFKRMSERHKQKKEQNQSIKQEENNNEKQKKQEKKDYINVINTESDIQIRQKNSLLNLIFDGYTNTYIEYKKHKLKLRSLLVSESEQAYKSASSYAENQFYSMYQLFVLSYALLEVDDYIFNNSNECLEFLYQLPYIDINKLYKAFYEDVQQQNQIINNISYFYDLINEPFFRMKYKVMRAFHCLPTEKRCTKMNDAQWLWLYYNLEEDMFEKMDENQDNLDYLGFYLNSDAAKKIMKHNQDYRKKRDQRRKARFNKQNTTNKSTTQKNDNTQITANQTLDNYFTSTPITNDNTVYSTTFEKELAAALGTTDMSQFTEISDDNEAGNPLESEEEFMERVNTFAQVAGTQYGYVKPEKPPKIYTPNRNLYSSNSNAEDGGETKIQRYLNNITKKQQLQNNLPNQHLPIQKESTIKQQPINNKQKEIFNKQQLPIQNKQITKTVNQDYKKQQADIEFMRKMHINSLADMDKFKNMQDNKNLDFIDDSDE